MNRDTRHAALAAAGLAALAAPALATTLPYSTGFEAAEGYANNSQLVANANWSGDGQDTTGWTVTNGSVGGSGAASGSQWVLTSGATSSTTKFQWTVTPVTDFSVNSTIVGSVDAKLVSPSSGTLNRDTLVGVAMFDASVTFIGGLSVIHDIQNAAGLGAGRMLAELDFGDGASILYDLGVSNVLNSYFNLALAVNFQTDTVTGYINGNALPDIGSAGGATDFHDFDLILGSATSTSAGTRARGGFDNYAVYAVPTPGTFALMAGAGGLAMRRRRSA